MPRFAGRAPPTPYIPFLRPNVFGRIVQSAWEDLPRHYSNVELDAFVVMPNHVHGIVVILANGEAEANPVGAGCEEAVVGAIHELPLRKPPSTSRARRRPMLLGRIIGRFKMTTAKSINLARGTTGVPVWQRNYYEHAIRDERDIQRIREYILANPARWAKDPENASVIN